MSAFSIPNRTPHVMLRTVLFSLWFVNLLLCPARAAMLGDVTGFRATNDAVFVACGDGEVQIQIWDDDIIRVWFSEDGKFDYYNPYNRYLIQPGLDGRSGPESLSVEDVGYIKIQTKRITVRVEKEPFRLLFYERDNRTLITGSPRGGSIDSSLKLLLDRDANGGTEHFFGLPQGGGQSIDQRDATVIMDENNGWGWPVPFFMSSKGYGIFFHNDHGDSNLFTMSDPIVIENTESKGQLDFFFFYGPDLKDVLDRYTFVTGRPPMYPRKMLGFQYICDSEQKTDEGDFDDLRERGYPVDACITFIDVLTGDDSAMVEDVSRLLREMNGASVCYFDVGPRAGNGPGNFSDILPEDTTYPYDDWAEYKSLLKTRLLDKGVDWFWVDETDGYDERFQFHHLRATFEAMEEYDGRRGGMCSRGGSAGSQRFAYPWMGDVPWGKDKIVANLKNALAGIAHSTHDLAGYMKIKPEDSGRMQRGIKVNLFNPITQLNNWKGGHMPWDFNAETQAVFKNWLNLHYRLLPYWYTMVWEAHQKGLPDRRPLVLYYQDDENVYSSDQFMSGEWFLFAPVYHSDTRDVYLPEGTWYNFFDNTAYEGPATLEDFTAKDNEAHLFVKAGAIIPMGPEMMYVEEKPLNPLTLRIYPHQASEYTLYEDDGRTLDYRKGLSCTTTYQSVQNNNEVVIKIGARKGKFTPSPRDYRLEVLLATAPNQVTLNGTTMTRHDSMKTLNQSDSGYYYDPEQFLHLKFKDHGDAMLLNIEK